MSKVEAIHAELRKSCPSCGSTEARPWGQRDGHSMLECVSCDLTYFPRPIESLDYQDYYPYLKGFDADRFAWELDVRRSKLVRQLEMIRKLAPKARDLVDIGAGPGYFCRVAEDVGFAARGVEPAAEARRVGAAQYKVSYVELDAVANASVDVVTCHHVLEHIEEPQPFLAKIRSKLRDEGLLVLHVPHRQPLSFRLREMMSPEASNKPCSLYYPIHINGFTSRSLVRTVERQCFRVVSVTSASMWSVHYDPFFLANYFRSHPVRRALWRVAKHATRCAVDVVGNPFGRGDWLIGHFRTVSESKT